MVSLVLQLIQHCHGARGVVAQWTTRLTTDQKIPGSTPGSLEVLRGKQLIRGGANTHALEPFFFDSTLSAFQPR